jgi:glutaredoxin 3
MRESNVAKIEIYSTGMCGYCVAAKNFLAERRQAWEEYRVDREPTRLAEMLARSAQRRSVPQIFIDGRHIGGYEELVALDRAGELDPLLAAGA